MNIPVLAPGEHPRRADFQADALFVRDRVPALKTLLGIGFDGLSVTASRQVCSAAVVSMFSPLKMAGSVGV
jgi:hypothetical protein